LVDKRYFLNMSHNNYNYYNTNDDSDDSDYEYIDQETYEFMMREKQWERDTAHYNRKYPEYQESETHDENEHYNENDSNCKTCETDNTKTCEYENQKKDIIVKQEVKINIPQKKSTK